MGWKPRRIENILKERLCKEFDVTTADEYYANYINARRILVENILKEIKAIENDLTDHSEDHIGEVLDNVQYLLGDEIEKIHPLELYFLCMVVLFHDVGNIHGRTGHYEIAVIHEIYNYVRKGEPAFNEERKLVCRAASAHSGRATDGSSDTMKELRDTEEGLFSIGINLRKLAPILRFADELAEGPNRTSDFMIKHHKYHEENEIHHLYARATSVYVDRGNGRIVLGYTIDVKSDEDGNISEAELKAVEDLLKYCYKRIIKLNEERRYNKYYSPLLEPFNRTEVKLDFTVNDSHFDIGLGELVITDLRVPGEHSKSIPEIDQGFTISNVMDRIKENCLKIHES